MRILSLLFLLGVGCDTPDNTDACDLFEDHMACPECYDGDVTCSYGDTSVTQGSCGGCQAEAGLYAALCEAVSPTQPPKSSRIWSARMPRPPKSNPLLWNHLRPNRSAVHLQFK